VTTPIKQRIRFIYQNCTHLGVTYNNKEIAKMYKKLGSTTFFRFLLDQEGQDFAEYALILGAVGVVAIAVIVRYREELIAAFEQGIQALRAARGG
jgi:Flp pilus assembly pilin Flp